LNQEFSFSIPRTNQICEKILKVQFTPPLELGLNLILHSWERVCDFGSGPKLSLLHVVLIHLYTIMCRGIALLILDSSWVVICLWLYSNTWFVIGLCSGFLHWFTPAEGFSEVWVLRGAVRIASSSVYYREQCVL